MELSYLVMYQFGLRGREWIGHNLTPKNLVTTEETAMEYVDMILSKKMRKCKRHLSNKLHSASNRNAVVYFSNDFQQRIQLKPTS